MTNRVSKLHALTFLCFFMVLIPTESKAKEQINARFDNAFVNLPHPDDYCILGGTPLEDKLLKWQTHALLKSNNKVLAMWIGCEDKQKLMNGESLEYMSKWLIVNGILLGENATERAYPSYDPEEFKRVMAGDFDLDTVIKKTKQAITDANIKYLNDKDAVTIGRPIDLGVLSITDSVHKGLIIRVSAGSESRTIAAVASFILINGIPVGFHFYSSYENKKTIKNLLSESEHYSAKLVQSN